jgi:hypothetical protein
MNEEKENVLKAQHGVILYMPHVASVDSVTLPQVEFFASAI